MPARQTTQTRAEAVKAALTAHDNTSPATSEAPAHAASIDAAQTATTRAPATGIYDAINRVMQEVGYVRKEKIPSLNYSFAGESALIAAIRPAMVEHGIIMSVQDVSDVRYERITTDRGASMWSTTLKARVRFYHAPSETWFDVCAIGEGRDSGDKSHNKAMTGAYKYALRQTFCIETGDDPDRHSGTGEARKPSEAQIRADIEKAKRQAEAKRLASAAQKPSVEAQPTRAPLAPLAAVEKKAEPQNVGAVAAAVGAQVAAARRMATAQAAAAQLDEGAVQKAAARAATHAPATTMLNSPATLLKMVNDATNDHYQGIPHLWNAMREKDKTMTTWPRPADAPAWNECARFLIARVVEDDGAVTDEELPV